MMIKKYWINAYLVLITIIYTIWRIVIFLERI